MTPTAEIHPSLLISRVTVQFLAFDDEGFEEFTTNSASEIFRRLDLAAQRCEMVDKLTIEGRAEPSADDLAALNAYLRTARALAPGGVLPFNRTTQTRSRWDWNTFLAYLDLFDHA